MKKALLFAIPLSLLIAFSACKKEETPSNDDDKVEQGEFLASTEPENRKVLLEDFTGVRCGYCPDGHVRAKALADANPDKVFIVAVHSGNYAAPANGWANFTNAVGDAINSQAAPIGYPAGTVNRIKYDDLLQSTTQNGIKYTSKLAMSRGSWATAASRVFAMSSPVNVGAKATFDEATRKLTVKVDLFYTSDETDANNINVFLLQDNLVSRQSGSSTTDYVQNHVLRDALTGNWGEAVTESTTTGSKVSKTYTYDVPADYNGTNTEGGGAVVASDLKVIAFVSRGQLEVLNGTEVDVE